MVFVGLSYRGFFNPVLLEETILFGFLWIFFLFKLFRRSVFLHLVPDFFPSIRQEHLSWKFFKGLFVLFVRYSTIVIETCLFHRAASPWKYLFYLFFKFFLSRILYNGTFFLRYALFLLGFCSFISFKGFFGLSLYLRDGSTPTSPALGLSFFESISDSLLHICYSQIVEAMTDPILTANSNKGFSPWASARFLLVGLWGVSFYFIFSFLSFFRGSLTFSDFSFQGSLTFFRFFFSGLFNIFRLFRYLTASTSEASWFP